MKAAVVDGYGPPHVVRITDVPTPVPRPGEVLVRVHAAAVTAGDARIRGARFPRGFGVPARLAFGVRRPRRSILGMAFSGVVEAAAHGFAAGDEVCGMTGVRLGAHAEYVAVPVGKVVGKPAEVSHDDAAGLLFGASTALHFLRGRAAITRGTSVLVNGASGAVGTNAVQLAKHFGATVTGVTSAANAALVTGLGADRVVDHRTTDVTGRFDVVLDTVGNLTPATGGRLLTDRGVLLLAVATLGQTIMSRGRVRSGSAPERAADFALLLQMVAKGELTVVLDDVLDLDGIVAAHERVDSGRKVGNLVIRP
ncbi:NAD(P)-dependent alcohol dehydrogenase [Pseudonocardia saturnea]